jgi:hypothetical protein
MNKRVRIVLVMLGMAAVGVLLAQPPKHPFVPRNPPFTLFITPMKSVVKSGDKVRTQVGIKNSSDHRLRLRVTYSMLDYGVTVWRSDGTLAPDTELGNRIKNENDQIPRLRVTDAYVNPNGVYIEAGDLFVGRLYDMDQPGQYTIQLQRDIPEELGGGIVKSNVVTVTVTE